MDFKIKETDIDIEADWVINRLRTRLLAYRIFLRETNQQARRRRMELRSHTRGDPSAEREGRAGNVNMPSWSDVADQILTSEVCEQFFLGDASDEERSVNDQQLYKFVEGERKGVSTGNPYVHFTTPQPYIRNAILAFLVSKGFLLVEDLKDSPYDIDLEEMIKELSSLGLEEHRIPSDKWFRGDYVNALDGDLVRVRNRMTIHPTADRMSYIFRLYETTYERRRSDSDQEFADRIRKESRSSRNLYFGCALFSTSQALVVAFRSNSPSRYVPSQQLGLIPSILLGSGIDPVVALPQSPAPKKDIAVKLQDLVEDFTLGINLGIPLSDNIINAPVAVYKSRNEFERHVEAMDHYKYFPVFSITYDKNLEN